MVPGLSSPDNGHRIAEQFATSLPLPGHLPHAISRPKPGLSSPGLGHRIESFLEQRSAASSSDVALQPARKLVFLLELILMTRLRLSRLRQQRSAFFSTSCEQAEPMRQRLKMDWVGKTEKQYKTESPTNSILSRVNEPLVQEPAISLLV